MVKNIKKFMVYTFTVLVTKLVYDIIMKSLPVIKSTKNPYMDVAIGMTLTVIIFYPCYILTHDWMEKLSEHYVKNAGKIHRNNFTALFIAYVVGLLFLYGCYMKLKFNINVITEILDKF